MGADADARIRDDEIRCAEALDEIARRGLGGLGVDDVELIGDDGAGKREVDRAARDQGEDRVG